VPAHDNYINLTRKHQPHLSLGVSNQSSHRQSRTAFSTHNPPSFIITNNQTDRSILRQKKIVLHKPKKDLDPALEMSVGEINLGIG
jgi:hypothetical protein